MSVFSPFSFLSSPSASVYEDVWALWDASAGGASGQTWTTVSGSNITITSTNALTAYVDDSPASYFTFETNGYLTSSLGDFAGFAPNGSGWTANIWVMPASFSTPQGLYWFDTTEGAGNADFAAETFNNRFQWNYYAASSDTSLGGTDTFETYTSPNTDWWMNTIVWNGVQGIAYINSVEKGRFSTSLQPSDYPDFTELVFKLGQVDKSPTTDYLNGGRVAIIELWNRGIDSNEVTELWDYNKSRFGY
jgi:hypothetical protein